MSLRKTRKTLGSKMRGRYFDEYRCFQMSDFYRGDSIRVKGPKGSLPVRGVVTSVDSENNLILYKTADSDGNVTVINNIVSLEGRKYNWLGNV